MTKKKTILTLILAIAVFFAMALSVSVITHDAEHECIGIDCPVCQQTESARQILRALTAGILAMAFAIVLTHTVYLCICCFARPMLQGSLVALKVELLN